MSNEKNISLQYLVIIAEQKKKDKFITLLTENDAHEIRTIYGRGSMSPSAIAAAFGFEAQQSKVIISCLVTTEKAKQLINTLYKDYKFEKPNTGIAFTVAVEGLMF